MKILLSLCAIALCASGAHAKTAFETLEAAPQKDNPVFFAVPDNFAPSKPINIVVYFQGNLEDETFEHVLKRQRLAEQIAEANVNAVLIAPYFGETVAQSVGTFGNEEGFKLFMQEAFKHLATLTHIPAQTFMHAPVTLVAYSGGFGPAKALFQNNASIESVLLLDAHYGPQKVFVDMAVAIAKRRRGVFVSAYSQDTDYRAEQFAEQLHERGVHFESAVPDVFTQGMLIQHFVPGKDIHFDFVTKAWTANPITDFLKKAYSARP